MGATEELVGTYLGKRITEGYNLCEGQQSFPEEVLLELGMEGR